MHSIYTLEKAPEYNEFQSTFFFLVVVVVVAVDAVPAAEAVFVAALGALLPKPPPVFGAVAVLVFVVVAVPAVLPVGTAEAGSGPVKVATGCIKAARNKQSRLLLTPVPKPPPPLLLLLLFSLPAAVAVAVVADGSLVVAVSAVPVVAAAAAAGGGAPADESEEVPAASSLFLLVLLLLLVSLSWAALLLAAPVRERIRMLSMDLLGSNAKFKLEVTLLLFRKELGLVTELSARKPLFPPPTPGTLNPDDVVRGLNGRPPVRETPPNEDVKGLNSNVRPGTNAVAVDGAAPSEEEAAADAVGLSD